MKQIYLSLFVTMAILLAPGCSKENLEVDPVNEFLSENFYATDEQVFSGLVAAYDP